MLKASRADIAVPRMIRITQIADVISGQHLLLLSRIPQMKNSSTPALIRKSTMARLAVLHPRTENNALYYDP